MRWIGLLLWTLVIATAGYGMFQIKFEVQALEAELTALNTDIRNREEAIRVLRAEWSYLNEPNRLATLAARYLELTPVAANHPPLQVQALPDAEIVPALRALPPGGVAVVAGNSFNIPDFIAELGVSGVPAPSEYDNLWVVRFGVTKEAGASMVHLKYWQP